MRDCDPTGLLVVVAGRVVAQRLTTNGLRKGPGSEVKLFRFREIQGSPEGRTCLAAYLPPGRGVWGLRPQFPKGGRVGIKDICPTGTMPEEKTSASLNSYSAARL